MAVVPFVTFNFGAMVVFVSSNTSRGVHGAAPAPIFLMNSISKLLLNDRRENPVSSQQV